MVWKVAVFTMRMSGSRYNRRRKKIRRICLFCVLLCFFVSFFTVERKLGPVISSASRIEALSISTEAVNEAAAGVLADKGDTYSSLIQIQRDESGSVTSVSTDVTRINQLKSELSLAIQRSIAALDTVKLKIPLGSVTGNSFLMGRGPSIPVKLNPLGAVTTDFKSSFTGAGINQTRHQIYLNVTASVQTVAAGYKSPVKVDTSFLVAESVIVGAVPDAFTEVFEDSAMVGDLMDFGATQQLE